ncbi:hypothetical protein [Nostoc sp. LPT]|nr:hypothetical protein [Nostoc sp. LPT]
MTRLATPQGLAKQSAWLTVNRFPTDTIALTLPSVRGLLNLH